MTLAPDVAVVGDHAVAPDQAAGRARPRACRSSSCAPPWRRFYPTPGEGHPVALPRGAGDRGARTRWRTSPPSAPSHRGRPRRASPGRRRATATDPLVVDARARRRTAARPAGGCAARRPGRARARAGGGGCRSGRPSRGGRVSRPRPTLSIASVNLPHCFSKPARHAQDLVGRALQLGLLDGLADDGQHREQRGRRAQHDLLRAGPPPPGRGRGCGRRRRRPRWG